ncbi:MAG: phosphomannomutase/phosphoglucomutase [Propioniciclava sp.]
MLSADIFMANDIRGRVDGSADRPSQWDPAGAHILGATYVDVFGLHGGKFVLGRDTRTSGLALATAFMEGATAAGADVVDVGLVSTDALWFASGTLQVPGVMLTASHNPPSDNGIKFCLAGAAPVTPAHLIRLREASMADWSPASEGRARVERGDIPMGQIIRREILDDYGAYLRSLVDLTDVGRPRVVVDAGNGMAGLTTPVVLGPLGLELIGLYLDLDGTFPNHMPNPLIPENLVAAQQAVRDQNADVGLVFDGDADRCFVLDELGEVVSPSVITALIARALLQEEPGGTVVVNTITSRAVAENVEAAGGRVVVSKVGHTSVKAHMAEHGAVFGGEHSAHYYFRNFWGADTGMLAALHVLALLGGSGGTMSGLAAGVSGYTASGEINSTVADPERALARVRAAFEAHGVVNLDDGLTITGSDWWVNARLSNTEPLLRLNVESRDQAEMIALRDRALAAIREESAIDD